ncbi:MAG: hypothetical protein ACREN6_17385 [Gemmatimonadaceae bacterium]
MWRKGHILAAAALAATLATASRAAAQDSTKVKQDSIAARLDRAEEQIKLLQQELADESQTSVKTRSRIALELTGRILVTGFSNSRRVNNVDDPQFVRPDTASGLPQGGAGMAIRQTSLGLAVNAPEVFGGNFHGDLDVDFYGGQQPSTGGRTFPLLRLRTARAMVKWTHGELMIGQDAPLIASGNPTSLAALGTPDFAGAGNLWLWLPQVRAGLETGGAVSLGIQGAVLAPTSGDPANVFDTDDDIAEHSSRPYLQGRVHVRWGSDEMERDIGIGVHQGWLATKGDSLLTSSAFAVDVKLPIARWLDVRGEAYTGQALKGLGGGGIGQGTGLNGVPVHDQGGWAQVNFKPSLRLLFGAGYGMDDPRDSDLGPGSRLKNVVREAHIQVRPGGPFVVGVEYRRLETSYSTSVLANDHLNLSLGIEF